ncbi:MAG: translocation/assembly module TamB domain-containing protein [Bacteroidota bacterium]|nr:translocation/assembly module TamB domain-containing protein [Bacteroidota bacterium]
MKRFFKIKNRIVRNALKLFLWISGGIILFLIFITLLLHLPFIQNAITGKIENFVSNKTDSTIEIKSINLSLPRGVVVKDIYTEDLQKDTLFYCHKIKISVNLLNLVKKRLKIERFEIDDLSCNIKRSLSDSNFNFDFIVDVFASEPKNNEKKKDTLKKGMPISIENIELSDINFCFNDEVSGNNLLFFLENLNINFDSSDLLSNKYFVDKISISGIYTNFVQSKMPQKDTTEKDEIAPMDFDIALNSFELSKIKVFYANEVTKQNIKLNLGNLALLPESINIANQKITLNNLLLQNTEIEYKQGKIDSSLLDSSNKNISVESKQSKNKQLGWTIALENFKFKNNSLKFDNNNFQKQPSGMDLNHLYISNLNILLNDIFYNGDIIKTKIKDFNFVEKSGFNLTDFQTDIVLETNKLSITNFKLTTPFTKINSDIHLGFPSLETIADNPDLLKIDFRLKNTEIATNDIFFFVPLLAESLNSGNKFLINTELKGKLSKLTIDKFEILTASNTKLSSKGFIIDLTDFKKAKFHFQLDTFFTVKDDIFKLLSNRLIPSSIEIPKEITLNTDVSGSINNLTSNLHLSTSMGDVDLKAIMKYDSLSDKDNFEINANIVEFKTNKLLMDSTLGLLSMNSHLKGSGLRTKNIKAKIKSEINKATFNSYEYNNIIIDADYSNEKLYATISSDDENCDFNLDCKLLMDEKTKDLKLNFNLKRANLYVMNFYDEAFVLSANINSVSFLGDSNKINTTTIVDNVVINTKKQLYPIDKIEILTKINNEKSFVNINSSLITTKINSNFNISQISDVLLAHINKYFEINKSETKFATQAYNFDLEIDMLNTDLLTDVFLPDLKKLKVNKIKASYRGATQNLNFSILIPEIKYLSNTIDSIELKINSNQSELSFKSSVGKIQFDTFVINKFLVKGNVANDKIYSTLSFTDTKGKKKMNIPMLLSSLQSGFKFSVLQDNLIMNYKKWNVHDDNSIVFEKNGIVTNNFVLSNEKQKLSIDNNKSVLEANINNFSLSNLTNIIETQNSTNIINGFLDANVKLKIKENLTRYFADINISKITFSDIQIGNIYLKANNNIIGKNDISFEYNNLDNELRMNGFLYSLNDSNSINLDLDIDFTKLENLQPTLSNLFPKMQGEITGYLNISSTLDNPKILGSMLFENIELASSITNTSLKLKNEKLLFNKNSIVFPEFTILDSLDNKFVINGNIQTKEYKNMQLKLDVKSKDFIVMNTKANKEINYYGQINLGADIKIRGSVDKPEIKSEIFVNKGTDFIYSLDEKKLEMIESEGVVAFVDMDALQDSVYSNLNVSVNDTTFHKVKGIELFSLIKINEDARFKIITNPISGDYMTIRGKSNLNFALDRSGKTSLVGTYEIFDSYYKLSFYNLVKKEFRIKKGSKITWSGNPTDANLDIAAIYDVETSPLELISNEFAGMSDDEKNRFKQKLPFHVNLNMIGNMMLPEISFGIDIEKEHKVKYPEVATKLRMLATKEEMSERNKQVFALLVMGGFISEASAQPNEESASFSTTAAKNSVNGILTKQLNKLSGKYVKGVNLDFGLESFDDYSSGTIDSKTKLDMHASKDFFNERLTVEMESTMNIEDNENEKQEDLSNIIGDVAVIYKITPDGKFKLKASRLNEYDVFDGEIISSGITLIFVKDFDALVRKQRYKTLKEGKE